MDQQVLHHGPGAGAQLHRMGGRARPHRVRHQLPQPRRRRPRRAPRRLPAQRADGRAGRHPRDHRGRAREHRRALPGRHAHRRAARLPRRVRRRPDRLDHPAQHAGRLQPPRPPRGLHRPGLGGAAGEAHGRAGLPRGLGDDGHLHLHAGQRPDLQLRGDQLADGRGAPAFDILAWNADSTRMPADMHSFYLRSCYLGNELSTRRDGAGRHAARPRVDPRRPLRPRRGRGPHRAVGGQLPRRPRCSRTPTSATC